MGGWIERTKQNNGITPDNVGINGKVGEHNGGHWWGGYYGWKWPRGGIDIVLAGLTGCEGCEAAERRRPLVRLAPQPA